MSMVDVESTSAPHAVHSGGASGSVGSGDSMVGKLRHMVTEESRIMTVMATCRQFQVDCSMAKLLLERAANKQPGICATYCISGLADRAGTSRVFKLVSGHDATEDAKSTLASVTSVHVYAIHPPLTTGNHILTLVDSATATSGRHCRTLIEPLTPISTAAPRHREVTRHDAAPTGNRGAGNSSSVQQKPATLRNVHANADSETVAKKPHTKDVTPTAASRGVDKFISSKSKAKKSEKSKPDDDHADLKAMMMDETPLSTVPASPLEKPPVSTKRKMVIEDDEDDNVVETVNKDEEMPDAAAKNQESPSKNASSSVRVKRQRPVQRKRVYKDARGKLVTENYVEYETYSDEEPVAAPKQPVAKAKPSATGGGAKKAAAGGKAKQGLLTSFFTKKPAPPKP